MVGTLIWVCDLIVLLHSENTVQFCEAYFVYVT